MSIVGGELKRTMFCAPYKISASVEPPISSYIQSLKTNEMTPKMNCDLPVIVQDPFELSCNAAESKFAKVCLQFKVLFFILFFCIAVSYMHASCYRNELNCLTSLPNDVSRCI